MRRGEREEFPMLKAQIPFTNYFREKPLRKVHRVIPLEDFMKTIAPSIWPADKRKSFCHGPRGRGDASEKSGEESDGCASKDGNPFGPFWDYAGVDFVGSEFFGYDLSYSVDQADAWNEKYPPAHFPVLAFPGAPASFPVAAANAPLQKYLRYTLEVRQRAEKFISGAFKRRDGGVDSFLAIHLRNDRDWPNVCEHAAEADSPRRHLFASPQCLGERFKYGTMSFELCAPTEEEIIQQVKSKVASTGVKYVFVSADRDPMLKPLQTALGRHVLVIRYHKQEDYHVSLAIMSRADHFIGNCVSSFSAFVKRARDVAGLPSGFWNFPGPAGARREEL